MTFHLHLNAVILVRYQRRQQILPVQLLLDTRLVAMHGAIQRNTRAYASPILGSHLILVVHASNKVLHRDALRSEQVFRINLN